MEADTVTNVVDNIASLAPPLLADRVARDARLILSRDDSRRLSWLVRTKSRYGDLVFLRRSLGRAVEGRIRSGRFGARR